MSLARFEALLKNTMGLDAPSIGSSAIERALRERVSACEVSDLEAYWLLLETSEHERQELIEAVVVPETWFFRDRGAFNALARVAAAQQPSLLTRQGHMRVLSIPCSTGEEPYSIAMTLLDAGLEPASFTIDAIDISQRALQYAQRARYRKNSFRGDDQSFRDRFFDGEQLAARVKSCVRFHQCNLFAAEKTLTGGAYDAVFCRNLLIYFDRETQDRAVAVLSRLVAPTGTLFVGPAESALLLNHGFESCNWPLAFAFRRASPKAEASARRAASPMPAPRPKRDVSLPNAQSPPRFSILTESGSKPVLPRGQRGFDGAQAVERATQSTLRAPTADAHAQTSSLVVELNRALKLADEGDISAAKSCCQKVLRDHGPTPDAHYLLGLLCDTAGEGTAATEHYRRAIYLDPEHHEALLHLAMLMEQSGDVAAANRLRERAKRAAAKGART